MSYHGHYDDPYGIDQALNEGRRGIEAGRKGLELGKEGAILGLEGAGIGLSVILVPLLVLGGIVYLAWNHKKIFKK